MALEDYGGLISNAGAAVPDYASMAVQQQMAHAQITGANLANQQTQMQIAMQQRALLRQQQFGQQLKTLTTDPSAQNLTTIIGNFPELAEQAKAAWGPLNESQRRQEATQMGEIATLAANGDGDHAAQLMQARIDADQKAGITRDSAQDQQILAMLKSGDPKQIKTVVGMTALASGAAVGWEKAAEWLDSLGLSKKPVAVGLDQRLVTPQGDQLAGAQPKMEAVPTSNADGSTTAHAFNPYTGAFGGAAAQGAPEAEGGGQASGAATGGLQASVAHVLGNEGGLNKSDMNGSPTNFGINYAANKPILAKLGITSPKQMGNLTKDQAAQIYATKYWPQSGAEKLPSNMQAPYFDVYVRSPKIAKQALAQSGGDPAKFAQITNSYFQNMAANNPKAAIYAHAWATRDAGNAAIATGQAPSAVSAAGGAAPAPNANPYEVGGSSGALNTKGADQSMGWNAAHTAEVPIPGGPADPKSYSPQEIDDLARNWIATGPTAFASLGGGMGGGGISQLKKAALARATEMMAQSGISADQLPAIRSKYGALNSSMGQNTQILNMLQASERVLHSNAQQVLLTQQQLVKDKVINNASPLLNNTNLELWSHAGSPEVKAHIKAYEDAVNGLAQEYTKFMNSANGMGGNAAPSDAARGLAQDLNDTGQGPATMRSHINQIFIETGNKRAGIEAQNQSIQSQLSNLIGSHPQREQTQQHKVVRTGVDRKTGRRVVQYSDGSIAYGN